MSDGWIPGETPIYYANGGAYQDALTGRWYVRENGDWRPMSDDEVRQWQESQ